MNELDDYRVTVVHTVVINAFDVRFEKREGNYGVKRLDVVSSFCRAGISDNMFWLGAIDKANKVNGHTNNGHYWIVYFRENEQISNISEFAT